MTTVAFPTSAGCGKGHKTTTRVSRKGAERYVGGSLTWPPSTTTTPDPPGGEDCDSPFLLTRQQQQQQQQHRQRIPAEETFTVEGNGSGDISPSVVVRKSVAGSIVKDVGCPATIVGRPTSPFLSSNHQPQQQQQVGGEFRYPSGGSVNSVQMMAKAGYMPFDAEDRLEIFTNNRRGVGSIGGFDDQASGADDDWRGAGGQVGGSSGGPAPSGLDAWPTAYSSEIGEAWARQQQEGEGQQGLRQVCCAG